MSSLRSFDNVYDKKSWIVSEDKLAEYTHKTHMIDQNRTSFYWALEEKIHQEVKSLIATNSPHQIHTQKDNICALYQVYLAYKVVNTCASNYLHGKVVKEEQKYKISYEKNSPLGAYANNDIEAIENEQTQRNKAASMANDLFAMLAMEYANGVMQGYASSKDKEHCTADQLVKIAQSLETKIHKTLFSLFKDIKSCSFS